MSRRFAAMEALGASALGLGLLGVACGAGTPEPAAELVGKSDPSEARGRDVADDAGGAGLAAAAAAAGGGPRDG
ncbi:MAG TPA: hypothetical protein VF316_11095, partial [Polyangiaceae bacterium]